MSVGFTAVHLLLLFNLGILSLGLGVVGEYVYKVHLESKRRPLWLVDYTINLDPAVLARPLDAAAGAAPPHIVAANSEDVARRAA
jgi:dolichol-phosphate mannosyltransferase